MAWVGTLTDYTDILKKTNKDAEGKTDYDRYFKDILDNALNQQLQNITAQKQGAFAQTQLATLKSQKLVGQATSLGTGFKEELGTRISQEAAKAGQEALMTSEESTYNALQTYQEAIAQQDEELKKQAGIYNDLEKAIFEYMGQDPFSLDTQKMYDLVDDHYELNDYGKAFFDQAFNQLNSSGQISSMEAGGITFEDFLYNEYPDLYEKYQQVGDQAKQVIGGLSLEEGFQEERGGRFTNRRTLDRLVSEDKLRSNVLLSGNAEQDKDFLQRMEALTYKKGKDPATLIAQGKEASKAKIDKKGSLFAKTILGTYNDINFKKTGTSYNVEVTGRYVGVNAIWDKIGGTAKGHYDEQDMWRSADRMYTTTATKGQNKWLNADILSSSIKNGNIKENDVIEIMGKAYRIFNIKGDKKFSLEEVRRVK